MAYEPMIHLYQTKLQEATDEAVLEMVLREVIIKTGVMVDREELLKALRYNHAQYGKGYADGRADAVKWISVKERMPDEDTEVLYYNGFHCNMGWLPRAATHWMPLPEPPEEEEDATD